ncbi:MAG: undecaprenyldiphospho-muramoylpentapeptide beta-N-acetylglucosaminyltransferase [Nitrospinota bacterium]|nr:undecaprenyldiphospho-muramoylpentapeptide beta-N-acetylglucosaminyltransferase [Nitrospinota bacterium]
MKLIITGGGTGGHIYPGIAVARELLSRGSGHSVLWVGARRGLESTIVPAEGIEHTALTVTALKGKGFIYRIGSLANLARAFAQSVVLLLRARPGAVLGVGGYASGPMGLASIVTGARLAIMEQNAAPGFTNRWLGRFANMVFISWPGSESYFPQGAALLTGNPVRQEFAQVLAGPSRGRFCVLVIGGSQGAAPVNRAMVEAAPALKPLADRISILHQTGERDFENVKAAAASSGLDWQAAPYLNDMAQKIAQADLVISRAGAGAVSEICVVGRAAIYIPFAQAADDHQSRNAAPAAQAGAAIIINEKELTGQRLAKEIADMESDRNQVEAMAARAKALGKPMAAKTIVDSLLALAKEAA